MRYAFITIPTYPNGQIGMVLASLNRVKFCEYVLFSHQFHNHVNHGLREFLKFSHSEVAQTHWVVVLTH